MKLVVYIPNSKVDIGTFDSVAEAESSLSKPIDEYRLVWINDEDFRPCSICGSQHVTGKGDCDFCRHCYATGRAAERDHTSLLDGLREIDPNVGIWNSGGGCFILSLKLPDGRYVAATNAVNFDGEWEVDSGVPEDNAGAWAVLVYPNERAFDECDDQEAVVQHLPVYGDAFVPLIHSLVEA